MDYTRASGFVTDSQGRRQIADRDLANGVPGTDAIAADQNGPINEIVHCIAASGQEPSADDDTQLWKAITSAVTTNAVGRLLQVKNFTSTTSYTPSDGVQFILVEMVGGGGAGGGAPGFSNSANPAGCGGAGAAGGFARILFDLRKITIHALTLTIGTGGQCSSGVAGGGGSYTAFGDYIIANGGDGGNTTGSIAAGRAVWTAQAEGGTIAYGAPPQGMTVLDAIAGANGMSGFLIPQADGTSESVPVPPTGPNSPFGTGGPNGTSTGSSNQTGIPAQGYGAGGGGMGTTSSGSVAGGSGAPGLIRIWEFV